MKRTLLSAFLVAFLALAGAACYKVHQIGQPTQIEAKKTETIAYLSDLERRIAMFIIPVNYTTNGPWTSFELKASTNDFWHGTHQEIPESVYMQYFMDSDVADVGGNFNGNCPRDRAKLYICNVNLPDQGLEARSYTRIANTLQLNPISNATANIRADDWNPSNYPPNPQPRWRHVEEIVVLVDSCDLVRYPEDWNEDANWLTWHNNNLMWVYGRKGRTWWEEAHGSKPMWRPIAPVRWFKEMPNWAQLADEEYYKHNPDKAPVPDIVDEGQIEVPVPDVTPPENDGE